MEATEMLNGTPARQEGKKLWQYLSAFSACFQAIGVGTAMAWIIPWSPRLKTEDSWLPISEEQAQGVSYMCAIGAMIGALPAGALANKFGCKRPLLWLSVFFFLNWTLIIFAYYVWMLYVARLIVGVGVGASCVLVPTYLSDIAEPSVNGTLGALFQLFITIGFLLTFIMATGLNYTWSAIVCTAVEVIFVVTCLFIPESPVWLINQGRTAEASAALRRLRGEAYDVNTKISQLQNEAEENASRRSSVLDLVRLRGPRKALFICFAGMVFQQLSGTNAVMYYTENIFKAANISLKPDIAAILVSLFQCVVAVIAASIINIKGRKWLLIVSSAVMSASIGALALFFTLQEKGSDVSKLGWLAGISYAFFRLAFSFGMGPIPWMLMGELFTVELKGNASSLAVALNWFLVLLVAILFPFLNKAIHYSGVLWIVAVLMAISAIFTYYVVPETKGKSIQEMQVELLGNRRNKQIDRRPPTHAYELAARKVRANQTHTSESALHQRGVKERGQIY